MSALPGVLAVANLSIHPAVEVVRVAVFDFHVDDVAGFYAVDVADVDDAVDFRRIIGRASGGGEVVRIHRVNQHRQDAADFVREQAGADRFLCRHEALQAFLFNVFGNLVGQGVCRRAFYRRVGEAAGAVDVGFFDEGEQFFEVRFGLAGEADDEGAA